MESSWRVHGRVSGFVGRGRVSWLGCSGFVGRKSLV